MSKKEYREFTDFLLNDHTSLSCFWIYYRYDDMEVCKPLVVDRRKSINMNPEERLRELRGVPVRLRMYEIRPWFRLMNDFITTNSDLKIMFVLINEFADKKTVMCVGKKGQWIINALYREAMERVLVGGIPSNMVVQYAK